jgi:hypothetical protein
MTERAAVVFGKAVNGTGAGWNGWCIDPCVPG